MTKVYMDSDADLGVLQNESVAVLGYGSQGRAHALNLRDSGLKVSVGLRAGGPTWKQAETDGWKPVAPADAVKGAGIVAIMTPDMAQPALYASAVAPNLKDGAAVLFAHGFNIHYRQIEVARSADVILVAPKGPGNLVRTQFTDGRGVPCLVAVHQDATGKALAKALAYAKAIGGTRAGVLTTTFAEETETDLFGEQAVLCGGSTELVVASFETLVAAGYQPEVAYFECLHELKLIVDLLYEGGIARMHRFVSDTAKYGDVTRGPRVVDEHARKRMQEILAEIRSGAFATEWIDESRRGGDKFRALVRKDAEHTIEQVGKALRARMSWLPREETK